MISSVWFICAFVLLTTRIAPSFQNTFCSKLESVPSVKQLDIRSITKTTDGHLLILQEDNLHQLPLSSLDSLKHHFIDTTSQLLHFDWLKMPDESIREYYRLTRLEVLPTGGDGGKTVYHTRFDPFNKADRYEENYFYDASTLEQLVNFEDVKMPNDEYQTVMNGMDLEGYLFTLTEDGVLVKDLKSELLQSQSSFSFHIERSKDRLNFVKPWNRTASKIISTLGKLFLKPRSVRQDLTTTLPVGFIHEREVYLLNLATEEVYIFPYEHLTEINPNESPPHSIQLSESLSVQAFFHCANRSNSGQSDDDDADQGGLSGSAQVAILFGGLALVGVLIGVVVLLVNMTRASNQSGQIANYKVKSVTTTAKQTKANKVQMKKKKMTKQTSTGTDTTTTSTGTTRKR